MGKLGRKPWAHFVNIFLSIHFHHIFLIQYTDLLTRTITKLCLVYFFMFMGTLGQTCHFNFHSKENSSQLNIIIENSRPFFFKTKYLLLQKVLINKFLGHDGMRVLSSALFSSCMMVYHDDNPFLIFTITEKPAYC